MSKAPPAFQFYANDFVTGTSRFTTAETGGYILLLCEQWDKGSVPGDRAVDLAQIMRCSRATAKAIWAKVQGKFVRDVDGHWRNDRLEEVRASQDQYREGRQTNGANGGRPLKPSHNASQYSKPQQNHSKTSPISDLQSPDDQNKERSDRTSLTLHADFDRFWACYPKRKAKQDALKAWRALKPDTVLVECILAAIAEQSRSTDWLKDGGQFIPYPASWLRAHRWKDEPIDLPQVSEKTARTMGAILNG